MKIVTIGDIHAHNWKDFSTTLNVEWDDSARRYIAVDGEQPESIPMNSRLFITLSALIRVRDYCVDQGIPLCLCAGDVFHTRGAVDTTVFNSVYRVFQSYHDMGISVIMIAGNHDQAAATLFSENSLYPFQGDISVVSKPDIVTFSRGEETVNICCVPYSKDKKMVMEAVNRMVPKKKSGVSSILLAHLGISGGLVGSGNYVMSDEYSLAELKVPKFQYAIFGHYHKPQLLEYNSIYTGSLVQNTFNDEGDIHGFWVLDTRRRFDLQFVGINTPQFLTLTKDNAGEVSKDTLDNNYVRIQATAADAEDIVNGLQESTGDESITDSIRLEVEKDYSSTRDTKSEVSITLDTPEILKAYVSEFNNTGLPMDTLMKKGLEILFKVQGGGE